jgi:hypothetical protein
MESDTLLKTLTSFQLKEKKRRNWKVESKAFEEGWDAYFFGSDRGENPYKMSQDEYQDWESGYLDAMDFDLFKESEEGESWRVTA